MNDRPQTWHYGLVARYWSEQRTDGPEIAYFRNQIERYGGPALDAGCGTGRLLIPYLRAGLDVDGCDVSPDMLALCRKKAESEGLKPRLYQQALHELQLPRTYQTIVACGVFGIGGTRQQDFIALQRFHAHLNPGGLLLLDNYLPYEDDRVWPLWQKEPRKQLPAQWPENIGKTQPERSDVELHTRVLAFDPLEQRVTFQMRALLWRDGRIIAEEEYSLTDNLYFRNELRQMLEQAGFRIEAIQGDYEEAEATPENDVIVFFARK
jgi:SAM-dependent methyltransferase